LSCVVLNNDDDTRFLCGVFQLGAYPLPSTENDSSTAGMNLAPVDFVARAIVHLSLRQQGRPSGETDDDDGAGEVATYHFVNYNHARRGSFLLWGEVVDHLLSFGHEGELEGLPYDEWQRRLMRAVDNTKRTGRGQGEKNEDNKKAKEQKRRKKEKKTRRGTKKERRMENEDEDEDRGEEERRCPALVSLRSYFQGSALPFRAKEYSFAHTLRSAISVSSAPLRSFSSLPPPAPLVLCALITIVERCRGAESSARRWTASPCTTIFVGWSSGWLQRSRVTTPFLWAPAPPGLDAKKRVCNPAVTCQPNKWRKVACLPNKQKNLPAGKLGLFFGGD
jgi:hypothetical protein